MENSIPASGNKPNGSEMDEGWWASVLSDDDQEQAPYTAKLPEPERSTKQVADPLVDWEAALKMFEADEVVQLEVYGYNRGGLLVQGEAIQGFVPVSHLVDIACAPDLEERRQALNAYVGKSLALKIIECEPVYDRIVLSERAALAGEGRRRELFNSLKSGEIVYGSVTNVTDFGAFVDLGGLEGLIHVSELSWGRVQHPIEMLGIGDEVRALVLSVSEDTGRVALSLKRLCPNPWDTIQEAYQPGDVVPATITKIVRFGAFARLAEGVEGLIHVTAIMVSDGEDFQLDNLKVGMPVQVRILHIDKDRRRLGLGLIRAE